MNRDQFIGKKKQFLHAAVRTKRDGANENPFRDPAGDRYGDHAQWTRKQYELLERRAEREVREFLRHPQG